jgi:hypothetical protein
LASGNADATIKFGFDCDAYFGYYYEGICFPARALIDYDGLQSTFFTVFEPVIIAKFEREGNLYHGTPAFERWTLLTCCAFP